MSAVGIWLVQNALVATAIALVLLLATRWLRPRPGLEHLLWLLVTVKFVLPPLAVLTLPSSVVDPVAEGLAWAANPSIEIGTTTTPIVSDQTTPAATTEPSSTSVTLSWPESEPLLPFPLATLLVALWLAVAIIGATWRLTRHHFWLRRVAASAEPAPDELRDVVEQSARRLRIDAPRVFVSRGAPTPFVTGLRRPVLYWPLDLIPTLGVERTRTIVMHELAHLRRRDLWTGVIEIMVDSLWRWYPGWRIVRRRLRDAAERACDAVVVESDPQGRRQYAEAILDVLSLGARRRQAALTLGVDGPGPLEQRIEGILHPKSVRTPRAVGYASLALVGLAVLPWWSRGMPAPQLAPMSAALPEVHEDKEQKNDERLETVTSRGVVGWDGARLELERGGWLLVTYKHDGWNKRLEAWRGADGAMRLRWIINGQEWDFEDGGAEWLSGVFERRGYDPSRTRARQVTGASGGTGTYLNMLEDNRASIIFWSTTGRGYEPDGELEPSADAEHPVYLIHQQSPDAPLDFFVVAREGERLRVLDRSIDGRPAPTDDVAAARARETLRMMVEWLGD